MTKIYTLVTGTRPQIIKSAPILKAAKKNGNIEIIHIFTGQHYDKYLADVFFQKLEVEIPKYQLNVRSGTTDYHIRSIIDKIIPILKEIKPKGVIVPGDTNSALAAGLSGMFTGIPIMHVESGLRSFDFHMQEEINRRLIDHGSSLLFAPTSHAIKNLKNESVLGKIVYTGDTMFDLLKNEKERIIDSKLFEETARKYNLVEKEYIVLTIHRRENLSSVKKLKNIFDAIKHSKKAVIFPMHPHTKKMILEYKINIPDNIKLIDPLGYHEFLNIVSYSNLVVTDSGGLQKETYLLNVPCVTLRTSTEWLETVEKGANKVVGSNPGLIIKAIEEMYGKKIQAEPSIYGNGKAAEVIVKELAENNIEIPTVPEL
ncbi:MAG: non-hydrolyzing UDP-N-acetylglucosamine 2-epimerase [Candidatus Hodarchaeales archaeon]